MLLPPTGVKCESGIAPVSNKIDARYPFTYTEPSFPILISTFKPSGQVYHTICLYHYALIVANSAGCLIIVSVLFSKFIRIKLVFWGILNNVLLYSLQ